MRAQLILSSLAAAAIIIAPLILAGLLLIMPIEFSSATPSESGVLSTSSQ